MNGILWIEKYKAVFLCLTIFFVLEHGYSNFLAPELSEYVIDQFTVSPCAQIINWLSPHHVVDARANQILSPSIMLTIDARCAGIDALMLLIAVIAVLNISWKQKLLGVFVGAVLLYALNLLRIVGLFFALDYDEALFDLLHEYVAPLVMISFAGLCFMLWLSCLTRQTRHIEYGL